MPVISHSESTSGDTPQFARIAQLRLRDLLLLEHIAATGSLRQVAELLHVTQPAITLALRGLEQAFGVELAERGRRGVTLTAAGEAALARLRVARRELEQAHQAARNPAAVPLRIGTLPVATLQLLPQVLPRVYAEHPGLDLVLSEDNVGGLWEQLACGALDAIVCRLPSMAQKEGLPPGIVFQAMFEEQLALVGPATLRALRGRPTLQTLAALRWVLPPPQAFTRDEFNQLFLAHSVTPPAATITSMSFHTNLQMAAACGMLTVVPESAARRFAQTLGLRIVSVPWETQGGSIVLAMRESSEALAPLRTLRRCCAELAAS